MKDFFCYSLLAHNSFGIDAKCRRFIEIDDVEGIGTKLPRLLEDAHSPLLILGGGSNLLLTGDYEGTVLHSAIRGMRVLGGDAGHVYLECGSGEVFDDVVEYAVRNGYYGAENLSFIPGEVGASAVQNIGAYGVEAKDIIYKVKAVEISTGNTCEFSPEECEYGYRQSKFKKEWKDRFLITSVVYRFRNRFTPCLEYGNIRASLQAKGIMEPTARQVRDTIIEMRKVKLPDPKVLGNAGSFFMNPVVDRQKYEELAAMYPGMPHYMVDEQHEKIPAGWMIEQCGWKGKKLGRVGTYEKQALVIVNHGGATGADIVKFYQTISVDVKDKFGVELHPEVNIV